MVDPRYVALCDPDRSRDDFSSGLDGECPPPGATVWLFRWRMTEAAVGVLLEVGRPMTIGEILAYLERRGILLATGHPRKALSDLLRYQARRGRVRRIGRGRYEVRRVARTTAWRYRTRLRRRNWEDTTWELTDSRPTYDVPLPPELAAAAEAAARQEAWMQPERLDIRQIAEEWALRSGLWPSDS
jgi:hypothetical protein